METSEFLSLLYRRRVERGFTLFIKYGSLVHGRCSVIRKCLAKVVDFLSRNCSGFTDSAGVDEGMTLEDDVVKRVAGFSCLIDVPGSGEKERKAVAARVGCGWRRFEDRIWQMYCVGESCHCG